jgi:multidrug efflux pump subunit AcrA (membrane-fusion protein)
MKTLHPSHKKQLKNPTRLHWYKALCYMVPAAAVAIAACAPKGVTMLKTEGSEEDADKLLIVDCLLPGQIKKLGAGATYVTPRRPAKLTAMDCEARGGEYVAYDQANSGTALKVWLPSAQDGNMVAQTYVGEIYEKGFGIEPDYELAAVWYKRAAAQGHARAKLNLGYLYEKGLGVEQDLKKALTLYRDASGLSETDMEFESFVDSTTIASTVDDVRSLKSELVEKKEELDSTSKQLTQTQQELARERQQLAQEALALQQQEAALEKEKQNAAGDKQQLASKEKALRQKEKQLNKRIKRIEEMEKAQQDTMVAQQSAQTQTRQAPSVSRVSIAGPSVQLVNPQLVSMRGLHVVNVRPGTKTKEIIGNIDAPAGLQALSIDGKPHKVNDKGLFRVLLPVTAQRKPVKIVAIDNLGKRAEIEFELVQSDKPKAIKVASAPSLPVDEVSGEIGNFHALVIGNNKYTKYPKLSTAVNDAKSVARTLSDNYGYKTTTLINANRFMILAALNRLSKKLSEKDNLLVYYAGHGELDRKGNTGFWLPVDAARNNKRNWIPNSAISEVISAMPVKRVLVIADSCYSGSLTRSSLAKASNDMTAAERLTFLRAMAKSRARLALTSGGLKPVTDEGGGNHSLFANALLNVLNNNDDILEGQRLYQALFAQVTVGAEKLNIEQEPQYAPIRHAGHESGEFFFLPSRES